MTTIISIDFETWNVDDIKLGIRKYAENLRILMMAWHVVGDSSPAELWRPPMPFPEKITIALGAGAMLSGWNAMNFERIVWGERAVPDHGFPKVSDDIWVDSMHLAAAANLPRGLDGCARAVGAAVLKDAEGHRLMLRVTNGNRTPWPPKEEDLVRLGEYCVKDVLTEEATAANLPPWPQVEPWLGMPFIDRKINDRGILVDVELVRGMIDIAAIETNRLNGVISKITDKQVPKVTNVEGLKRWLIENKVELRPNVPDEDEDDSEDEMEVETPASRKSSWKLAKNDIADLLARDDVPDKCREALAIRAEAGKASISKMTRMLGTVSPDWRLRQAMQIGGAQQTMRWASPGVNLYNTVRDVFANPDEVEELTGLDAKKDKDANHRVSEQMLRTAIESGRIGDPELIRALYERPRKDAQKRVRIAGVLTWISRMARRTLAARRGQVMMNGDFAQIEARLTVWYAQQLDMLHAFATGQDPYRITAAGIFKTDIGNISKEMRQTGKVSLLALGFGGGPNALVAMGYNYGLVMSIAEAIPIVKAWRESNPQSVAFWYAVDDAAANAVMYPGHEFPVGPLGIVSYFMEGDCLCCRLPTGRLLRYWQPRLTQEYWDKKKTQPKARLSLSGLAVKGRAVFRRSLYHTILVENIVQATGADILGVTLVNADRNNVPVTLHVYDSMGAEVDEDKADAMMPLFEYCMLDQPSWTAGLPIAADVDYGARFG